MVTMPSEEDFNSPQTGDICKKYFRGSAESNTMDRMKILRLIENMTLGSAAVGLQNRIHARGRQSSGTADYDRQTGETGRKERTGKSNSWNTVEIMENIGFFS